MSGHRGIALVALTASLCLAPNAFADQVPQWNGHYVLTLSANAKRGTSIAANQPEYAHLANHAISSSCSAGTCIATVNDPEPPKNESMPQSIEFRWNGTQ